MYPLTYCTNCQQQTRLQPVGNLCHNCHNGYHVVIENQRKKTENEWVYNNRNFKTYEEEE